MRIAINGFGRIGRLVVRALSESQRAEHDGLEIVAINDLGSAADNAHLLRYDSVHGPFRGAVEVEDGQLVLRAEARPNLTPIATSAQADPAKLPWKNLAVDLVLECTGRFASREQAAAHLSAGAARVLVSAPAKGADATIVYGVNHDQIAPDHRVLSNGSCTTNCLAPLVQILHRECGLVRGFMTTIHAYTGDQRPVDMLHSDLRRARAAALSLIPTSTGAAKAIGLVLPELDGKLDGTAIRVPSANVSLVDLVFQSDVPLSLEKIHDPVIAAAQGRLKHVLRVNHEPLVSVDFTHDPHSCIFDATQTQLVERQMARVLAWYDNEWGFANRLLDVAAHLAAQR